MQTYTINVNHDLYLPEPPTTEVDLETTIEEIKADPIAYLIRIEGYAPIRVLRRRDGKWEEIR